MASTAAAFLCSSAIKAASLRISLKPENGTSHTTTLSFDPGRKKKSGFSCTVTDGPAKKKNTSPWTGKGCAIRTVESTTSVHNEDPIDAVVHKRVSASALRDLIGYLAFITDFFKSVYRQTDENIRHRQVKPVSLHILCKFIWSIHGDLAFPESMRGSGWSK